MGIKVLYVRRNRFGQFSKTGHYYAIRGEIRKLPKFRQVAPSLPDRKLQPPPVKPRPEPVTPPTRAPVTPVVPRAGSAQRRGAKYSTWFKAAGTMQEGVKDFARNVKSPDLLQDYESEDEGYAVPGAFFSNQGSLLGRVKWNGIIPLETLIGRLNFQLQFLGEEANDFDFRQAYSSWSYKYQVIESIGPTDRVVEFQQDRRPRK